MRTSSFTARVLCALALASVCAACATARVNEPGTSPSKPGPSDTLAPSIFYEEGKLVFFGVNAGLARLRPNGKLLPFEIAIENKGLEQLRVSAEYITLRSSDGRTWPVTPPEESEGSTLQSEFDRSRQPVSFQEIVGQRVGNSKYVPSTFGLRGGNITMSRTAELRRNTWTFSQVWFPNPGGELKGQLFEVWLDSPDLPDPVFTTIRL